MFPIDVMQELDASLGLQGAGLQAAKEGWRVWQGGNQWTGYESFLSFFRHVAKLPIDYTHYDAWEVLALHSGPRLVYSDFCMISDRPEKLVVDEENRPHCEDGPFCRWRDGSALYAIHGVRVPQWIVEHPEWITEQDIDNESNAEIRRILLDRYGVERYMRQRGEIVETCADDHPLVGLQGARLLVKPQRDDEPLVFVEVLNPTKEKDGSRKRYLLAVDPEAYGGQTRTSCLAAVASTWRRADGSLVFPRPSDYAPIFES